MSKAYKLTFYNEPEDLTPTRATVIESTNEDTATEAAMTHMRSDEKVVTVQRIASKVRKPSGS